MRVNSKRMGYWESLPVPNQWKILGKMSQKEDRLGKQLVKSMMDEWLSTHPMAGG